MNTVTQSPGRERRLLLALVLCSLGRFPNGEGSGPIESSGLLPRPETRDRSEGLLLATRSSQSTAALPLPLPTAQQMGRSLGEGNNGSWHR